ncbi:DUF5133 domain-containing protein [Streptomyces sp. NPDC058289]|uniref:DUF5133 domain-containing protein n=1 Tax=Streptomyces sp. NPDC058289 TaxID=3346425 RepID=UPI0036EAA8CD
MNQTPAPHPAAADGGPAAAATTRAVLGRATGVVMALVPCTAETARRIILGAAQAAGVTLEVMASTAAAMHSPDGEVDPALEQALRTVIGYAQVPPTPLSAGTAALLPTPFVLRGHLSHLRAVRRRTMTAPDDPTQRAALEDAVYTLCVLMGQRSAHGALTAAEHLVATHLLPPSEPSEPSESSGPARSCATALADTDTAPLRSAP